MLQKQLNSDVARFPPKFKSVNNLMWFVARQVWCAVNLTVPYNKEQLTVDSNFFKIAQKTAFEGKGWLYTTGKVIQRLFIIDLYT